MYLYYLYHFRQVSRSRSENNTSLNKVYEYEKKIQVAEINKPHVSTRHNTCFILQFRVFYCMQYTCVTVCHNITLRVKQMPHLLERVSLMYMYRINNIYIHQMTYTAMIYMNMNSTISICETQVDCTLHTITWMCSLYAMRMLKST